MDNKHVKIEDLSVEELKEKMLELVQRNTIIFDELKTVLDHRADLKKQMRELHKQGKIKITLDDFTQKTLLVTSRSLSTASLLIAHNSLLAQYTTYDHRYCERMLEWYQNTLIFTDLISLYHDKHNDSDKKLPLKIARFQHELSQQAVEVIGLWMSSTHEA